MRQRSGAIGATSSLKVWFQRFSFVLLTIVSFGVLLIVFAWILIMIYVRWTNTHYDHRVADERRARRDAR